jgi:hypothetical protein
MWDCQSDGKNDLLTAMTGGKDVPCNTHCYFDARGGQVNMTVCCRSNDIVWGAYGANAVHFAFLLEYIASVVGLPAGEYRQLSNNYHCYTDLYPREKWPALIDDLRTYSDDMYPLPLFPLIKNPEVWFDELHAFLEYPLRDYTEPFFSEVAAPMFAAWNIRKMKQGNGLAAAKLIKAEDWRIACTQWIIRREK